MLASYYFPSVSSIPILCGSNMYRHSIPAFKKPIHLSSHLKQLRRASFGAVNMRSVVRKLDDVMVLLNNSELDYLGLIESWLNETTSDAEFSIEGHTMLRCDRGQHIDEGGGGILVYM